MTATRPPDASDALLRLVLPDVDVSVLAFSRTRPDPLVVHRFAEMIERRQLVFTPLVRHELLARTRDSRQFSRLEAILAAFPDCPAGHDDHRAAAVLVQRLRRDGVTLTLPDALLWAVAERIAGVIWSRRPRWIDLAAHGCPLLADA